MRSFAAVLVLVFSAAACGSDDEGQVRRYFIAAEEVEWDYAPDGNIADPWFDQFAPTFLENLAHTPGGEVTQARIGRTYRKALYRAYTDATFTTPVADDGTWAHLGALGPTLMAEVGDTFEVTFKNDTVLSVSVHPHGVRYDKANEGAPYNDGTSGADKMDDAVPPGETYVYTWEVPERAGPGPGDPSSVMWMYHSHTDEVSDTYAGLIGGMIVTARGRANPDGSPKDVDRQFVNVFHVYDENKSQYLGHNTAAYAGVTDPADQEALAEDPDFEESNLMHAVNGYLYANLPGLTMRVGERIRWYVMGMGTEVDIHTPHWHGATVLARGMRTDVIDVFPATMHIADMEPDEVGTWLYHCHVNDHLDAGMIAVFDVAE